MLDQKYARIEYILGYTILRLKSLSIQADKNNPCIFIHSREIRLVNREYHMSFLCRWKQRFHIYRWRKTLRLNQHRITYQQLFSLVNGFELSKIARNRHGDAIEYTYGEIEFESFIALLSMASPCEQTIFYDLGSGIGTAIIASALVFPFKKYCGIELFPELHTTALQLLNTLLTRYELNHLKDRIYYFNDNILNADFHDATLIFINATVFFGETWQQLNQRLATLTPHATIITTSKKLTTPAFSLVNETWVQMSWGVVRAYIYQPTAMAPARGILFK